jgi:hypothetical protein
MSVPFIDSIGFGTWDSPAIERAHHRARQIHLEVLIPILYLKGVSTGDFEEALLWDTSTVEGGQTFSPLRSLGNLAWTTISRLYLEAVVQV